jgi:hypothetical protein
VSVGVCVLVLFRNLSQKDATERKWVSTFQLKASDLLADLFSSVADDDVELQAMLTAPRIDSSVSDSTASSLVSSPLPSHSLVNTSALVGEVKAYCRFTHEVVCVRFPTDADGWVYRIDLGGTSQHRFGTNIPVFSTCGGAAQTARG